ncbi:YciI family protein [Corynebacterium sp. ES2794-CONJ1]|uniref:YciI family protein n=1 Tax=unclassified Corynebacterium TaxID=2624378 RepID=UPI002167AFCF|nr:MULTISPECIES: YciI family protein [unclassified Corynebacterium]MCS4489146.1 YciI family protein [Corynebacterium sp. ES2775-CONJ]MCS4490959.1 YciI family protein [Corynebacterium sp. ES2715-CONJ3]MCS4531159.1 YciI family protein [Corynebacterium sp. ES2730-CONJ]MCU9518527.1 YciI family protein [Corynebacterium sp. ES2794-CONJ1]
MTVFAVEYSYSPTSPTIAEIRPQHRSFLAKLKEQGILIGSGPYTDGKGGALIIIQLADGADLNQARELLDHDPFFTSGALEKRHFHTWNPVLNIFGSA